MQSEHRKIELQSPTDLTYLTSQLRAAARQKLDLHLPPQPSDPNTSTNSPDDLRLATETLIDAFVARVLRGLRENISINGIDVVPPVRGSGFDGASLEAAGEMDGIETSVTGAEEEDFEPFDDKLRQRLAEQVARRDKLVAGISRHRRETAGASKRAFEEAFLAGGEEWARLGDEGGEGGDGVEGLGVRVERADEVRRNWERVVEGLARLDKGVPETRARLERCGDVVGYLEGGK